MSAGVEAKARRLLADGHVQLLKVRGDLVEARVRSAATPAVYEVRHVGAARWRCSCPAVLERCAHVVAVELVVTPPPRGAPPLALAGAVAA